MGNNNIPVVVFVYNRVAHLEKCLQGLKRNGVPKIYFFVDGPQNYSDIEKVSAVLKLLKGIDWCEVVINTRDVNIGLANNIRFGVTETYKIHEKCIFLEDDIVMRPGAYKFMNTAIDYFYKNELVSSISMWNHPALISKQSKNGFYSKRFVCWGWSSSRDLWEKYTGTPKVMEQKVIENGIDYKGWGSDLGLQIKASEERNLWYAGYAMTHFLYGKLTYFPPETLVVNIGRDETANNSRNGIQDDNSLICLPVKFPKEFPSISVDQSLPAKFRLYFDHHMVPPFIRLARRIKNKLLKSLNFI